MDNILFQRQLYKVFFVFAFILMMFFSAIACADVENNASISNASINNASINSAFKNNDEQLFLKAVELSAQKQWPEAESIYRDLMQRNKRWPELGNNLAVLLLKTNRLDEAKNMLELAVTSSPAYRITQENRTQLYRYLASRAYDKALGVNANIELPELQTIPTIYQSITVVEKEVEKIIIKEVIVNNEASVVVPVKASADINDDIKKQLLVWSDAWTSGDFNHYIGAYSVDFLPSDMRKSYAEWKNIRRARLKFTKGVNVEIEQFRAFIESQGEYALVEFIQKYRSDSYSDKVLKQMYMHKSDENWLILSERTIKNY